MKKKQGEIIFKKMQHISMISKDNEIDKTTDT